MTKLSVIIPTYKPEDYIYSAIESIKNQNIQDYDIEVIVVLNGEKYPYYDLLNSIKLPFQYKIIYTEIPGVSNARNIGIEVSEGEFIMFVDDDDLLSANYLNSILPNLDNNYTIYVSNVLCFKEGTEYYYKDYIGEFIESIRNKSNNILSFSSLKFRNLLSSCWCKAIPRNIIKDVRFNQNLTISEDALFMFEISKNIRSIVIYDEVYYYRRVRLNSSLNREKKIKTHFYNYFKFNLYLGKVYFNDIRNQSLLFYLNRIAASTKFLINNILK